MSKKLEKLKYIAADYFAAALAWTMLYIYRKAIIEPSKFGYKIPVFDFDRHYYLAIIIVPLYWFMIYWLFGSYKNIYRKSRIGEVGQTFTISFIGTILLFFFLLLDDIVHSYKDYRYTFLFLFTAQFLLTAIFRLVLLTNVKRKLKRRQIGYNTLLIGGNKKASKLYHELENEKYSQGYLMKGYMTIDEEADPSLAGNLPRLGNFTEVQSVIKDHNIEEVILAVETSEHHRINNILTLLEGQDTIVKAIPDMYDIITGSVKMNYIFGTALIEVMPEMMPTWQKNLKRFIDIAVSLLIFVLLSPFYLAVAIGVKMGSTGPVFYKQERIGKHGKPFTIYKFRSMYTDAEKHGPALSSDDDPRITPFGRFLRRYRFDEFPQFWNVLIGEMSLVGPRPERQHFIDQIVKIAPHYHHLHKVKPGITSWGQIKFGYAENVEQMVERMKFDILYIENMSIAMDIKILFYTILIIVEGRGK